METLESSEQFLRMTHIEPGAIVTHKIDVLAGGMLGADLDLCMFDLACELDSVRKQILENLSNESLDSICGRKLRQLEIHDAIFGGCGLLFIKCSGGELVHVDIGKEQLFSAEARQRE